MASFVTIPIEARTSVYEYLLSGMILSPRPVARRTRNATQAAVGCYPAHLNLLMVNRQLFSETSRIFLRFVTIRLKSRDQLQVLVQQPLIANLIIDEKFGTETDMLATTSATTAIGALNHVKSITFELDRGCEVGQSLEDASHKSLKSTQLVLSGWGEGDPSLIYIYSLWYWNPLRTLSPTGRKVMDRLTNMVGSGTDVIFVFEEVEFCCRDEDGFLEDDFHRGWMSMRDWIARFEQFGEIYEIPQQPYHKVLSTYTCDGSPSEALRVASS